MLAETFLVLPARETKREQQCLFPENTALNAYVPDLTGG